MAFADLNLMSGVYCREQITQSPVTVLEVARQRAAAPPPPAMIRANSLWNRFLLDDELIKMGGLISKRKGLFSKKRQVSPSPSEWAHIPYDGALTIV
jgi:hypothetical protein